MKRADNAGAVFYGILAFASAMPAVLAIMGGFAVPGFCLSLFAIAFGWAAWDDLGQGGGDG